MIELQPYPLWISHAIQPDDVREIMSREIQAVVQLASEEPTLPLPRDLIYVRVPIVDGAGNDPRYLDQAVEITRRLIAARMPTLVCCGGGMSRSPAIVAAALAKLNNEPLGAVLERIAKRHSCDVSLGLWSDLTRLVHPAANALSEGRMP